MVYNQNPTTCTPSAACFDIICGVLMIRRETPIRCRVGTAAIGSRPDNLEIRGESYYDAAGTGLRSLMSCSISTILTEKPHSLSYQEKILIIFLPITMVERPSKMDE